MKDCVRYAPMLGAREGELSREEQSALDAHLQACPGCRTLAADLAALDGLVGESLMARANARDFAPFVDGVMARVGAPGAAPVEGRARGARGFLGWFRAHPRAPLASLVPVLAAVALVVYVRTESADDGTVALFEMATEGEVTMVLQTSDGPVVLLGEEHS